MKHPIFSSLCISNYLFPEIIIDFKIEIQSKKKRVHENRLRIIRKSLSDIRKVACALKP